MTLCIPLAHNPEPDGTRFSVDPAKIDATEGEIVEFFGGFQAWAIRGKWKDPETGEVIEDELIRYRVYAFFTIETFVFLANWLPTLEARFEQCAIFAAFDSNSSVIR